MKQYSSNLRIYKHNSFIYLGKKSKHIYVTLLTLLSQINMIFYDIPTQIPLTFPRANTLYSIYCINLCAYLAILLADSNNIHKIFNLTN
jgi:hypothetical protein